jgi:hypothetical protein
LVVHIGLRATVAEGFCRDLIGRVHCGHAFKRLALIPRVALCYIFYICFKCLYLFL